MVLSGIDMKTYNKAKWHAIGWNKPTVNLTTLFLFNYPDERIIKLNFDFNH